MVRRLTILGFVASVLILQFGGTSTFAFGDPWESQPFVSGSETVAYAVDAHAHCELMYNATCNAITCSVGQCTSFAALFGDFTSAATPSMTVRRLTDIESSHNAHLRLPWRPPINS